RHLLPRVLSEHGLAPEQLKISAAVMQQIIIEYTREAGMRNLERQLANICRKVARLVLEKPNRRIRLTAHNLEQYLGTPRYSTAPPSLQSQVGSAMGLAVTENGGILLPVEVVTMVGKGDLLVTGQLGDVMRESAIAALSYIRTRSNMLRIDPNFQDATDLHIHLPEGAIPKDGPSAGITIATSLVSALTRRPVRGDVAMTGEVTLLGNVLPIGGLKEKVLAAQQANITHLIVPAANKKDLAEIPDKIRQRLTISLVNTMDEVIDIALLEEPVHTQEQEEADNANEPILLHRDEHTERAPRVNDRRRHGSTSADEERETGDETFDSSELILPSEHNAPDNYPQASAEQQKD
ncbi:MAG: endopeptidase La, partial [Ktedonobacteraceae bacterium]|nr:endopeptidase La [Ktedonobacteraceae bacterium]